MSIPFRAGDVAAWTDGFLRQGPEEARFTGTGIDSRQLKAGDLFIAIVGPSHDAHHFLGAATTSGARGFVIERGRELPVEVTSEFPIVEVDDTTRALGHLASRHRADFGGPLVAITGSNGKTTTKEMCAAILSISGPCLKNEGNLNNQFGLPLTLLRREASDRRIVVEIGMNHRGEIAALSEIAQPTIGVITNVGSAHIEHLGTRDEIAREKGDLLARLPAEGTAVVNADDPQVMAQAPRSAARVVSFGRGREADVRADKVTSRMGQGYEFELCAPEGRVAVELRALGETAIANALAAAAAALAAGASLDDVTRGLSTFRPVGGRLQRRDLPDRVVLIDDTYNANPESVAAALQSLAQGKGRQRGLVVIGEMGELGETSASAHAAIGTRVVELGLEFLFAMSGGAEAAAEAALKAGMPPERVTVCSRHADLAAEVSSALRPGDWILVKGSRAAQMERVVESLAERGKP